MGGAVDKIFLEVAQRPIISHTWERFDRAQCVDEIVLVIREDARGTFEGIASRQGFQKPHRFVIGGAERQDSVVNGVNACDPRTNIIAIHDGARPCVTEEVLERTIAVARETGAAVTGSMVIDTIKSVNAQGVIDVHLDRARLRAVQTPQVFHAGRIRAALEAAIQSGVHYTDDTAALQALGYPVTVVESADPNPKATIPGDLALIERLLIEGAAKS